jgi:hypothetical protein
MKQTIGSFEKVSFPEFGMDNVVAKVDTGAFTGALHATKIHEEEEQGVRVLYFSPFDHPKTVYKTDNFEYGFVKSSNGAVTERYFIETYVEVRKKRYAITLTLADRSEMKWPVLIGRRFLHANEFIVDVSEKNR